MATMPLKQVDRVEILTMLKELNPALIVPAHCQKGTDLFFDSFEKKRWQLWVDNSAAKCEIWQKVSKIELPLGKTGNTEKPLIWNLGSQYEVPVLIHRDYVDIHGAAKILVKSSCRSW